jgi:CYTH domain-containing protein
MMSMVGDDQGNLSAGEAVEFELTFLARGLPPGLASWPSVGLIDVYIPSDRSVHPRVRLRQKGDDFELTKKVPLAARDASAHSEITIPLSREEYIELSGSSTRRVEKIRYAGSIDGYAAEVDIFMGALKGLVLMDFEFGSREELDQFVVPSLCLADVTQEDFVAGGLLAGRSFSELSNKLQKFGYVPL